MRNVIYLLLKQRCELNLFEIKNYLFFSTQFFLSCTSSFSLRTFTHNRKSILQGPIEKINKIKSSLDWYFIKYANSKVLWTCYSISTSTVQRQLIWESYSKADGYVRFMTDMKMVTWKVKSCLSHIKKQISTITKLELQAAVLANRMKVIIPKSSKLSINKVHFVVQLNIRVAVYQ